MILLALFLKYGFNRLMMKDVSSKERYLEVVAALSFASRPSWPGTRHRVTEAPVKKSVDFMGTDD
jgi:hypothetical protein